MAPRRWVDFPTGLESAQKSLGEGVQGSASAPFSGDKLEFSSPQLYGFDDFWMPCVGWAPVFDEFYGYVAVWLEYDGVSWPVEVFCYSAFGAGLVVHVSDFAEFDPDVGSSIFAVHEVAVDLACHLFAALNLF